MGRNKSKKLAATMMVYRAPQAAPKHVAHRHVQYSITNHSSGPKIATKVSTVHTEARTEESKEPEEVSGMDTSLDTVEQPGDNSDDIPIDQAYLSFLTLNSNKGPEKIKRIRQQGVDSVCSSIASPSLTLDL